MQQFLMLKRINTLYFFAVLLLSLYFGVERTVFCDTSMQLFDMATNKLPNVSLNMFTVFINFIFAYLAILTGCSLKTIVALQVVNYMLLPLLVFIFLRYKQTDIKYESAFLLAFSVFNWQTFYYPIHDYWTGFYLLFILYRIVDDVSLGLNQQFKNRLIYMLILGIIFTHLTMVIAIGFLFLYLFAENRIRFSRLFQMYSFMGFILVIKFLFINSGYQNSVLDLNQLDFSDILRFYSTKTFAGFFDQLFVVNTNFAVMLLLSVAFFLKSGNRIAVVLFSGVILFSFLLIYLLFKNFGFNVYTEGYFKALNVAAVIIFSNLLLSTVRNQYVLSLLVSANFIFSVTVLFSGGQRFKEQYDFINESCKRFNGTVYLHSAKNICPLECLSVSRQSLIINQLENGKNDCIFSNINDERFVRNLNTKWINENETEPVRHFTFNFPVRHLDADSMQYPIDSLFLIFAQNQCEEMTKRLDQ
jgi:hypothetical protein